RSSAGSRRGCRDGGRGPGAGAAAGARATGRPAGPGAGARGGGDRRGHPGDRRHRPGTDIAARPAVVGPPGVGVTVDADPTRVRLDPADPERGLVAFVLTLVELLRQLMERQALRRVDHGDLS